jgi:hypothetical protein
MRHRPGCAVASWSNPPQIPLPPGIEFVLECCQIYAGGSFVVQWTCVGMRREVVQQELIGIETQCSRMGPSII